MKLEFKSLETLRVRSGTCPIVLEVIREIRGVDKTRNMEHSVTFRNIPEHPETWKNKSNFHEKKIN